MGFSNLHSSEVPLVLNLQTGSITPQYHVVFDDFFSTVSSIERETDPPEHWSDLCLDNSTYIPTDSLEQDVHNNQTFFLDDEWLTPDELMRKQRELTRMSSIQRTFDTSKRAPVTQTSHLPFVSDPAPKDVLIATNDLIPRDLGAESEVTHLRESNPREPMMTETGHSSSNEASAKVPGPTETHGGNDLPLITPNQNLPRRSTRSNKGQFTSTRFEDELFLATILTDMDPLSYLGQLAYVASLQMCPLTGYLDTLDPRVYLAHRSSIKAHNVDTPTLYEALNGPQSEEYTKAMQLEIATLEKQNTWSSVIRPSNHRVLKSTWAFKLKRMPDGTPY